MAKSTEELAHLEWLGYVQPVGLVVSIPALLEAQCHIDRHIMGRHSEFLACLPRAADGQLEPVLPDLARLTEQVLQWRPDDLVPVPSRGELPEPTRSLEVVLPHYDETLRPSFAVPRPRPAEGQSRWQMLVKQIEPGQPLDQEVGKDSGRHWNASPQAKFERLLRETGIPVGLLFNHHALRLVYAPRGESSGYATFPIDEMAQVAGRPIFAALQMLLCQDRLFSLGENERLPAILENSRKYQNLVSTELAEQVLAALYELMRGFQAANDATGGALLARQLEENPNQVYAGLLTVLMRLVFVLYAEDRDLISSDPLYSNHYSVTGLFDRLRSDAGRHPDTMDQRYGAWAQLLTLFRLVYEGGQHGGLRIPPRKGYLFDPDRYPFLEGRVGDTSLGIPRVADGVIFRVLQDLLILGGERLSYRALDVEQIGSVYETVMGFNLQTAQGRSIAIRPVKTHGAPATINLDALLATDGPRRAKWLEEASGQKLGKADADKLKAASDIDQLLTALDKKVMRSVTPQVVPAGAIVLQPSDERRRSGSHYTPRSLTAPIVQTTLEPVLRRMCDPAAEPPATYVPTPSDKKRFTASQLSERVRASERAAAQAARARRVGVPHPQQILGLKVCDPAMGSGAFLVETCRFLGDELVKAWHAHCGETGGNKEATGEATGDSNGDSSGEANGKANAASVAAEPFPTIPPDEDEVLYARRLVAQRCLYGVDKNEMAVDLAKLSLWLVTLARAHPFTFLDHSLRHGDSLVGLTRQQIIGFHWEPNTQRRFGEALIQARLDRATAERAKILGAREDVRYRDQETRLATANESLDVIRLTGDVCLSAFFSGASKKERRARCDALFQDVSQHFQNIAEGRPDPEVRRRLGAAADSLRTGEHPIPPFHWEIEFPEVFSRANGGFDAFVGNPPFAGKNTLAAANPIAFPDWLKAVHEESHGNADLVAHFFRGCFNRLRERGCLGLIATNTIGQGDTRSTGLRWLCLNGGHIYDARRRVRWPGQAAVIVSVVHVHKGEYIGPVRLDNQAVERITAFLFHRGGHDDPQRLRVNAGKSFQGSIVLGMGFTFDDTDTKGVATPLAEMERLVAANPKNAERIFPYIGGEEINASPTHAHHRYVINFEEMSEEEARSGWPDLMRIVEERVRPERMRLGSNPDAIRRKRFWWLWGRYTPALFRALEGLDRVLACGQTSKYPSFTFHSTGRIFSHKVVVFPFDGVAVFAVLQSWVHVVWALFFGSTMKDDPVYTPSDCFETFPFPEALTDYGGGGVAGPLGHAPDLRRSLEEVGEAYHTFRAELMVRNNEGLTKTYNRFHDPDERSPEIARLRDLHAAMDRVVLQAYGWHDLADAAECQFLLDYEDEEAEAPGSSRRKKPWRLRWPDSFRDEVLARLLELNAQRHREELAVGVAASKPARRRQAASGPAEAGGSSAPRPKPRGRPGRRPSPGQRDLLGDE